MVEHDYDLSMALADHALELMREHHTPATPSNYELFYTYAAGLNERLKSDLDQLAAAGRKLTADDTQALYNAHIAPGRPAQKIEAVGATLSTEISDVIDLMQRATASSEAFGESLKIAGAQLARITDPEQLKAVLQTIVAATMKMAANSEELKGRLADSKKQISELQQSLETVRVESYTDPLTGVANRKRFDLTLQQAIDDANSTGEPLSLMMIDIDHFKRFNDQYGHQTGDGVIKLVARTMQANVKDKYLLARYGGEEFAIVLEKTPLQPGLVLAEQIRRAVMGKELIRKSTGQSLGRITLSIGIAAFNSGETAQALIQRADSCLYAAKHAGRNCVKAESDPKAWKKPRDGAHAA